MTNLSDLFPTTGGQSIIDTQTFTSSGTWTKPAGILDTDLVVVDMWGGGGSGGIRAGVSDKIVGGPAGGGAHNRQTFRAYELSSSETATVASGGAAVTTSTNSGGAGNSGGYSEFKGHRAYGGAAGGNNNASVGTGGGIYEAGRLVSASTRGALPCVFMVAPSFSGLQLGNIADIYPLPGEWGGGNYSTSATYAITPIHGGASPNTTQDLRSSVWGGGAGGTFDGTNPNFLLGGLSKFGGKGGDATQPATNTSNVNGQDGSAPGGGGAGAKWGTTGTVTSGAGAAGRIVITVIRGI